MFQEHITKEEYHNQKTGKHNPTSRQIEISKVTDNNKIEYSMQNNAEDAKC